MRPNGHLVAATERPPALHSSRTPYQGTGICAGLRDMLEDKARQTRSIYGSRGYPTARHGNRHAGHIFGRAEHSRQNSLVLRHDIAQYRGAAHPLCFTDEIMDHQIPEGFKPVNIE